MSQPPDELVDDTLVMDTTEPQDWTAFVDPSEPRYCICNEVSYGDMVACDNADVRNLCIDYRFRIWYIAYMVPSY